MRNSTNNLIIDQHLCASALFLLHLFIILFSFTLIYINSVEIFSLLLISILSFRLLFDVLKLISQVTKIKRDKQTNLYIFVKLTRERTSN